MSPDTPRCASCGREIAEETIRQSPAICPHCGQLLLQDDEEDDHPAEDAQPEPQEQYELDELAIRRLVRGRRAMMRTRAYLLAGGIACIVLALQQVVWIAQDLGQRGFDLHQTSRTLLALGLFGIGWWLLGRARLIWRAMQAGNWT